MYVSNNCVGVLVICVLVFTVFCIVCTVFLYCFVHVYLFLIVFSVPVWGLQPSDNSITVNNNNNNNNDWTSLVFYYYLKHTPFLNSHRHYSNTQLLSCLFTGQVIHGRLSRNGHDNVDMWGWHISSFLRYSVIKQSHWKKFSVTTTQVTINYPECCNS